MSGLVPGRQPPDPQCAPAHEQPAQAGGGTRDQALRLVRAADTAAGPQRARTSALVAMLLFTGARVSEVIGADVGDLGTERGRRVLRVTRGDGGRRSLPLPGPAAARIDAYLARRAGLPDDLTGRLGPEAMRHSFATLYLDAGGSLSELQEVMGHADPRTTRRYDRERQLPSRSPGDLLAAYLSTPDRPRR